MMSKKNSNRRRGIPLPSFLEPLFWDTAFDQLAWNSHKEFIIQRVITEGNWAAVQWLRGRMDDEALRTWILQRQGRGVDKRRLRFWGLMLQLPNKTVDSWLRSVRNEPWSRRFQS